MYLEEIDSTFIHLGKEYNVNEFLRRAESLPETSISTDKLSWVLSVESMDKVRIERADITAPILYTCLADGRYVMLDGAHRTAKAVLMKCRALKGKEIPSGWL